jgi:hypothetical protein
MLAHQIIAVAPLLALAFVFAIGLWLRAKHKQAT